jgi:hypothetical protein
MAVMIGVTADVAFTLPASDRHGTRSTQSRTTVYAGSASGAGRSVSSPPIVIRRGVADVTQFFNDEIPL